MDYGKGHYIEGRRHLSGNIMLDKSRLYLSGVLDFSSTYVPLEKIENIKYTKEGLEIKVKFSAANKTRIIISLPRKNLKHLTEDIVIRLNLKKRFLRREWSGEAAWR